MNLEQYVERYRVVVRARNARIDREKLEQKKTRTLERGAGHYVSSPDGEYYVDHAGCADKEIPQYMSAQKRGITRKSKRANARKKYAQRQSNLQERADKHAGKK